ncbi:MAG TPA: hypothetical protein VN855_00515 [Candidatus Acidoferrum sp.]|nr:hypothetical protein [Candidatus Acidoferrum sp.]
MDELPKSKHPQALSPEERKEWHQIINKFFALYSKMPLHEDPEKSRKIMAGMDEKLENCCMFFRGSKEDLQDMVKYLKTKDWKEDGEEI